jgi:hypothetical protein
MVLKTITREGVTVTVKGIRKGCPPTPREEISA